MPRPTVAQLVDGTTAGHRTSLARLLSVVERGGEQAREAGRLAYPQGGSSYTVGITGAPGAGKSTLTDRVVAEIRAGGEGDKVAVLAVDPSSPYTGGAILGDRVRMQDHAGDEGVFIRSMATRGHLGGLSLATPAAARVLDAAGYPWVLVETVGVGQVEVEIAANADTTIVVVNPGWGDAVQANKAGLMEIADVFVINKADRNGAAETQRDLEQMMDMTASMHDGSAWRPPVVRTVAATGEGVAELWAAVAGHRDHLESTGDLARRRERRLVDEVREIVVRRLEERADALFHGPDFEALQQALLARETDPYTAAESLLSA